MAKKYLLALTNPLSAETEAEFNHWYSTIHVPEVTALPGFTGGKRFRATEIQRDGETPVYRYLTLYELDDVAQSLASLSSADHLQLSPTVAEEMIVTAFEEIAFPYPEGERR